MAKVLGPAWATLNSGRYPGRFPLAVERHAMARVDELLPGITTVTPHARYYTLHGLIAAEADRRKLPVIEAQDLLRRAEVVLAGISLCHKPDHAGVAAPHGVTAIKPALETGHLEVAELSRPGKYAQSQTGYWGPYIASEITLGLVEWADGAPRPGKHFDEAALRAGLGDILDLARRDVIPVEELSQAAHLCMCRAGQSSDGAYLLTRLMPERPRANYPEDKRDQTLRLLLRVAGLAVDEHVGWSDVQSFLMFSPTVENDHVVASLPAYSAWRGVALRTLTVAGWRNLWAWLVRRIEGFMAIDELSDALADAMPPGSVRTFRDSLPATRKPSGALLPAEFDDTVTSASEPITNMSRLVLGAARVGNLPAEIAAYFEGDDERLQQLTPTWLAGRLGDWLDKPLTDFARYLTRQLVARSQRVAFSKASFDRKRQVYAIPTRVFVRDGFIRRDSLEGGGGVALRWDQAMSVLSGLGYVERVGDSWAPTEVVPVA